MDMKKNILLVYLLGTFCGYSQTISTNLNSVVEKLPKIAASSVSSNYLDVNIATRYIDGYGRTIQKNLYRASPDATKDIILETISFDEFGRPQKSFLPVPVSFSGSFNPSVPSIAQTFYGNDLFPYSENVYENSPLKRIIESKGVGQAWRTANKSVKTEFSTSGGIRKYSINYSVSPRIIEITGIYPPNSLFKTIVTNERNLQIIEYKDDEGRIIEIHKQDDTGFIKTAYVYDDFGRLAYTIQPKSYDLGTNIDENSDAFKEGVFANRFDKKGRIIEEHTPSTGWTYFVYNAIDQVILSQNARQRQLSPKQWDFKKYDAQNREIYEGIISDNRTRSDLQILANDAIYESKGSDLLAYTNVQFPIVVDADVKLVNYFDNYATWKPASLNFVPDSAYHVLYPNSTGLPTGQKIRNTETNTWTIAVSYYDNKNRVIQQIQQNLLNGINIKDIKYNFNGEALIERSTIRTNIDTVFRKTENILDHFGRVKNMFFTANSNKIEMASFQYDDIGKIIKKKIQPNRSYQTSPDYIYRPPIPAINTQDIARRAVVLQPGTLIQASATNKYIACINPSVGGLTDALQTIDYQYNIRGQLNCTNCVASNTVIDDAQNDLYSMKLDFHEDGRFYDGNISNFSWQSRINKGEPRKYFYDYDNANRIKNAKYNRQNSLENFSLNRIEYDKNSNITKLVRKGATQINASNQALNYGIIDSLSYDYQGLSNNRVAQIIDYVVSNPNVNDFRDSTSTLDYEYYDDGSLKSDRNKRINQINYNYLGLTEEIILTNNRWIKYYYDATGQKTKKITSTGVITDYVGDLIYTGTASLKKLYQFSQPEGRATPHPTKAKAFLMEYQYTDHLGNLQLAYRDSIANPTAGVYPPPIVLQENHTDPFGLTIPQLSFSTQSNKDKFTFGSHENQDDFGLGLFDMQTRFYDPSRGQLNASDLSADNYDTYSPFVYVGNNPVLATDPDGRDWYLPMLGNGLFGTSATWFDGSAEIKGYLHLGNENYVFSNKTLAEFEFRFKKFEDPVLSGFKSAVASFKGQYALQKFETEYANQDQANWETKTIYEPYKIREQIVHNGTGIVISENSRYSGETQHDPATSLMVGGWFVKGIGFVASGFSNSSKTLILYRGEQEGVSVMKSYASKKGGYEYSKNLIKNGNMDDLMSQHAFSSTSPASPFISVTSNKNVARFFAGPNGVVHELRIPANRAIFNTFNKMLVPAGKNGSLIRESEFLVPNYIRPSEIFR
jgi:RHS repeat-associated protein